MRTHLILIFIFSLTSSFAALADNETGLSGRQTVKVEAVVPYIPDIDREIGTYFLTNSKIVGTMGCSGKNKMPIVQLSENLVDIGVYSFNSLTECVQTDELLKHRRNLLSKLLKKSIYITFNHDTGTVELVEIK